MVGRCWRTRPEPIRRLREIFTLRPHFWKRGSLNGSIGELDDPDAPQSSAVHSSRLLPTAQALPCSTFTLARDDRLIVGHNLDQSFYTPGVIHVNRRSERKTQYQLDNFATVDEVLKHLPEINIETSSTFTPPASANYHLLVTDGSSNIAIIEFLKDGPQVYKNEAAPVPALCNRTYQQELDRLESYQGFLGWVKQLFDSGDDLRFVKCAAALEDLGSADDNEPVGYSFEVRNRSRLTARNSGVSSTTSARSGCGSVLPEDRSPFLRLRFARFFG